MRVSRALRIMGLAAMVAVGVSAGLLAQAKTDEDYDKLMKGVGAANGAMRKAADADAVAAESKKLEAFFKDAAAFWTARSNKEAADARTKSAMRKELQMVFQDPTGALDPRFTVFEVLSEPLENAGMAKPQIRKRIMELMELVGLQPDHVNRFPNQFSGG